MGKPDKHTAKALDSTAALNGKQAKNQPAQQSLSVANALKANNEVIDLNKFKVAFNKLFKNSSIISILVTDLLTLLALSLPDLITAISSFTADEMAKLTEALKSSDEDGRELIIERIEFADKVNKNKLINGFSLDIETIKTLVSTENLQPLNNYFIFNYINQIPTADLLKSMDNLLSPQELDQLLEKSNKNLEDSIKKKLQFIIKVVKERSLPKLLPDALSTRINIYAKEVEKEWKKRLAEFRKSGNCWNLQEFDKLVLDFLNYKVENKTINKNLQELEAEINSLLKNNYYVQEDIIKSAVDFLTEKTMVITLSLLPLGKKKEEEKEKEKEKAKIATRLLLLTAAYLNIENKAHIAYILATAYHESHMGNLLIEDETDENLYGPVCTIDHQPMHSAIIVYNNIRDTFKAIYIAQLLQASDEKKLIDDDELKKLASKLELKKEDKELIEIKDKIKWHNLLNQLKKGEKVNENLADLKKYLGEENPTQEELQALNNKIKWYYEVKNLIDSLKNKTEPEKKSEKENLDLNKIKDSLDNKIEQALEIASIKKESGVNAQLKGIANFISKPDNKSKPQELIKLLEILQSKGVDALDSDKADHKDIEYEKLKALVVSLDNYKKIDDNTLKTDADKAKENIDKPGELQKALENVYFRLRKLHHYAVKSEEFIHVNKGEGTIFKGQGLAQVTGRTNYTKFIKIYPFITNFWKKSQPVTSHKNFTELDVSAPVTIFGMREGIFTGCKLSHYDGEPFNFKDAREIVNGHDNDIKIADYAKSYYQALQKKL